MEVKTKGKYLRMSPKKMRLVIALIKGMDINEALDHLNFVPQKAAYFITKVLKSALANAEHNFDLKKENLFIKEIFVNEGPTLKRWRPRAFGRAGQIRKRSSHLEIVLGERAPSSEVKPVKTKPKEPVIEPVSKTKPGKQEPIKEKEKEALARPQEKYRPKPASDQIKAKGFGGVLKRVFRRKSI